MSHDVTFEAGHLLDNVFGNVKYNLAFMVEILMRSGAGPGLCRIFPITFCSYANSYSINTTTFYKNFD